ncbi:hypothetical protein OG271_22420 [Micromonospora rifamycinica]|uniref:hypothetical protein n=1 Tax=Micromonospora rifamycinica TaxID=291594 RepID=UPI002E28D0BB|nr:hypothetical protein [Micromonospora rifamycinica]
MIGDTDTLLVDGAGTLFEIDDDKDLVPGSALIGRDLSGVKSSPSGKTITDSGRWPWSNSETG